MGRSNRSKDTNSSCSDMEQFPTGWKLQMHCSWRAGAGGSGSGMGAAPSCLTLVQAKSPVLMHCQTHLACVKPELGWSSSQLVKGGQPLVQTKLMVSLNHASVRCFSIYRIIIFFLG